VALAHDRTGQGPPLVLIHPLGADRRVWDPLIELLAPAHEVIAVDLPGFGESAPLRHRPPTPRALAEAVAAELAEMKIGRAHLAGNSLGGWIALELGLSGVALSVTGIAPAGLWPEPLVPKASISHRVARHALPVIGPLATSRLGRRMLLRGAAARPARVPAAQAGHLVEVYGRATDFRAVNDAMRAGRFEGLERVRCPVTLVWPDHDRLIKRPVWVPDRIRNVVLADSGHIPMWDAPEALAAILLQTIVEAASRNGPPAIG
jgi:pimeloyl-ACP methyl ester carboxylesterase